MGLCLASVRLFLARVSEIRYGTMERLYLKLLLRLHPEIKMLLSESPQMKIKLMKLNVQFRKSNIEGC